MAFSNQALGSSLLALVLTGCFSPESDGEFEDGTGAPTGGDPAQACSDYCTLIGDHCEGDLQQYSGTLQCEAVCAVMEPGEQDAVSGNSLGCRTFHAINAAEDPQTHCIHAGPAGGGVCGGECESFCSQALALCTGDDAAFADFEACATECNQFPTDPPYNATVLDGDSFACRMSHLTLASIDPGTHCPHVVLDSPVCT